MLETRPTCPLSGIKPIWLPTPRVNYGLQKTALDWASSEPTVAHWRPVYIKMVRGRFATDPIVSRALLLVELPKRSFKLLSICNNCVYCRRRNANIVSSHVVVNSSHPNNVSQSVRYQTFCERNRVAKASIFHWSTVFVVTR